jgi:hypothetical protein
MKYIVLLLFALLITGCKDKFTEINGTVKGLDGGTMIIKDENNNNLFTENIEGGKFHFKKIIDRPGYYKMSIIDNSPHYNRRTGYDVYLEAGKYTVNALPEAAHQYPEIKSTSALQNELSNYYDMANGKTAVYAGQIQKYSDMINSGAQLSRDESLQASSDLYKLLKVRDSAMGTALQDYVNKYPQHHIVAHVMYELDFANHPEVFYPIVNRFTDEEKKSNEGQDEIDKLNKLAHLIPGAAAPLLTGKTMDGKPFDYKDLHKKIILLEFWRSDDKVSATNHDNLLHGLISPLYNKNFGMVSFSLDIGVGVWKNTINDQKLTWTQVCDFQGQDSKNVSNWQISTIPTYYLLTGDWKIIKRNIDLNDVLGEVDKYLKANP